MVELMYKNVSMTDRMATYLYNILGSYLDPFRGRVLAQSGPQRQRRRHIGAHVPKDVPDWIERILSFIHTVSCGDSVSLKTFFPARCPRCGLDWVHTYTPHVNQFPTQPCHTYNTAFQFYLLKPNLKCWFWYSVLRLFKEVSSLFVIYFKKENLTLFLTLNMKPMTFFLVEVRSRHRCMCRLLFKQYTSVFLYYINSLFHLHFFFSLIIIVCKWLLNRAPKTSW